MEDKNEGYNFEEFLRSEYSSLNASLIENEQLGERRIQFLISLAGALITAGGLLSFSGIISISEIIPSLATGHESGLKLVTFAVIMSFLLLSIIPFGFITLIRVVNRNSYTDYFVYRLNKIRTYYVPKQDNENREYLAFNPYADPIKKYPEARYLKYYTDFFGKGGIVPTVILLNTILFALLFSILAGVAIPYALHMPYPNLWCAILGFVVGWVGFGVFQIFVHNSLSKKFSLDLCKNWFMKDSYLSMAEREREDVLIICSDNPQKKNREIFEEIIKWKIPDESYQLISQNSKDFEDIYFDMNEKFFQKMKIALRVRKMCNKNIVTLKIPTTENVETGRNDIEIEKLWSKERLIEIFTNLLHHIRNECGQKELETFINKVNQILKSLARDNLRITDNIEDSSQQLDLKVVQNRYTHRELRNIINKGGNSSRVLAELAMDSVIFKINGKEIHHYDIEVEEKTSDGSSARESILGTFTSSIYSPVFEMEIWQIRVR